MKKTFEFEETVKYNHSIEIEVDDENEYEEFADIIMRNIYRENEKEEIEGKFIEKFGEDKVTFVEDGSPETYLDV